MKREGFGQVGRQQQHNSSAARGLQRLLFRQRQQRHTSCFSALGASSSTNRLSHLYTPLTNSIIAAMPVLKRISSVSVVTFLMVACSSRSCSLLAGSSLTCDKKSNSHVTHM